MRSLKSAPPLTELPDERRQRAETWSGMAAWAVGPDICGHCHHFARRGQRGSCRKAKRLLDVTRLPRFPRAALACAYFLLSPRKAARDAKHAQATSTALHSPAA